MSSRSTPLSPVAEMRLYAVQFKARCQAAGWFGALFHARVICDIAEDDVKHQVKISDRAYSAEQDDLEAEKLIADAIADGVVTVAEIQQLKTALRHVRRSREADHNITDLAHVDA